MLLTLTGRDKTQRLSDMEITITRTCDLMVKTIRQLSLHDNRATKVLLGVVSRADTMSDSKIMSELSSVVLDRSPRKKIKRKSIHRREPSMRKSIARSSLGRQSMD